jgi:peptidoglycan/xylan/chitin deacetylase (PgdA/CDA1 family)
VSVSEALADPESAAVAITFDDGCETDLISAAPLLKQSNCSATFYITVGILGRRGYLSSGQLRELSDLSFEIGSHSMTHPYLTELRVDDLHRELRESKTTLEEIVGKEVKHFSCPGGRWSRRLAEMAREVGYHSVATSRRARNPASANPFSLARIGVMRGTSLGKFEQICQGRGLWLGQLRDFSAGVAKRTLGRAAYDKFRSVLPGSS